jgi:beta-galactosidase
MFLWRQWAGFAVSEQVRFASEAIRAADPKAFVMVHAGLSLIKQDTAWFTSDDIQNAAHVDRYGTSFWIPLHPKTPSDHAEPENQSAWLRRVDPLYWCHEFYPNHGHWGQPPEPRNLKRLVWSAIAGGPSGFTYWQWRSERFGNETNGWGLRNPDGSSTARSDVADGIAAVLKKHGHRLAGTRRPRSRVAMLFSHESDLLSRIETLPICFADLNDVDFSVEYSYKRAIRAAYSLYTHLGEPPDWVTPGDDLSGVKLLHITAAEVISAKAAKWLTAYVQGGGTLVAEMPFACRDDNTWLATSRPNHGLDALLGCKEGERIVVQPGDLAKFRNGPSVKAGGWRVELVPGKGKVLATWPNGTAAAVHHRVGQGQVFTLGVSLALSNSDRWREPSVTQTSRLLSAAGLRPWPWTTDQVNVFRRCGPDREVWIVLNVGDRERVVKLPASAVEVWEAGGTLNARNELRIPGGGTWVAELPPLTTR